MGKITKLTEEGEHCQNCGKSYLTIYRVPDKIWKKITPKKEEGGLLCIECADKGARKLGINLYWDACVGKWSEE